MNFSSSLLSNTRRILSLGIVLLLVLSHSISAQSPSFQTYVNPVIPGDHPDPTLTKIGNDFYTSGSSFNPTPKIYHSTDLVHWKAIAQPVDPSWSVYGDNPGGGIWGGHMVLYNGKYWHYFGRGGNRMFFVTADQPEGPWSNPTAVNIPSPLTALGVDNSIFIDDNNKWYMLTKAGHENNHIIELGDNGQPTGNVLDLTWLNPNDEDNPYGWAEGPVMWKYNDTYYYSVAENLVGTQYVMKSDTLSDNPADWTIKAGGMQFGTRGDYRTPNHISPAIMLDDSTSWVMGHSYHQDWVTQGRQGLLLQITYDEDGFPQFEYPKTTATTAPALPNNGTPWMVPKSDSFVDTELAPYWSFLGGSSSRSHSLTERPGWLMLDPGSRDHTVIQNDGEHQYSILTRLDFNPQSSTDEAGLYIINGAENLSVKAVSTLDSDGSPVFRLSFDEELYEEANNIGNIAWLKIERKGHDIYAYYSDDGDRWSKLGRTIDATELNVEQTSFNNFTGNQQGLYVKGEKAFFDLYVYRDAYSRTLAQYPANYSGVEKAEDFLSSINNGDWAMYAGVEFGDETPPSAGFDYQRTPEEISIEAGSATGATIEIWLDSLDTGTKIAEAEVPNTGGIGSYISFTTPVDSINGQHDVYFRFIGDEGAELMQLREFRFRPIRVPVATANELEENDVPTETTLHQNYPNPFNPSTVISYQLPTNNLVQLKIFDMLGREVATLINETQAAGLHQITFDATILSSGMYFYQLTAGNFTQSRKMLLLK